MSGVSGLYLLGCGGHARSVCDVAIASGYRDVVFVDGASRDGETINGFPTQREFPDSPADGWHIFPAAGDNRAREEQASASGSSLMATIVSPRSTVARDATIAPGTFVGHGAHVGPEARIGVGGIVNTGAIVEHQCIVGAFAHVSVNATLAGRVQIGQRAFIGAGATVIDGVKICADAVVGAGAVITSDILEPGTWVGVPARRVK
jgi:sugar O-acyltransferase (sialic acid O-acetyltransferase NeuD family)